MELKSKEQLLSGSILRILNECNSLASLSLNIEAYQDMIETKHDLDDMTLRIK